MWDAEWAMEEMTNGRFGANRVRTAVYKDNCEIFDRWAYPCGGREISLGDRAAFLGGTKVYGREFKVDSAPVQAEPVKCGVVNADCVMLAELMAAAGYRTAILNLASRTRPCGGYDKGLNAQEEALCRASTLSQSLYQHYKDKYICVRRAHVPMKYNAYPLDINFGGIYSPDVTFFRKGASDGFAFRERLFRCGVITVGALSFREPNDYCEDERRYRAPDGDFTPEGDAVQMNKVRTIFRLALANGNDSVILGAFGCGVNELPALKVALQFRRALEEPEFKNKFKVVAFAILEGRGSLKRPVEEHGKFAPFYRVFGRLRLQG